MLRSAYILFFLVLFALLATPTSSQPRTPPLSPDELDALIAKAQQNGSIRLLVRLDVNFQPEGNLHIQSALQGQRYAIQRAQERVLNNLPVQSVFNKSHFSQVPLLAVEVGSSALTRLAAHPDVVRITEDLPAPPLLEESTSIVGATKAWDSGYTGVGQVIASLDTGIDYNHPFLDGKVVAEACFSTTSATYNSTTLCPDGSREQIGDGAGVSCPSAIRGCDHGSHVAGILAGKEGPRSGVAPDASLISVQIFSRFDNKELCSPKPSPCALSYTSDQIKALEFIYSLHDQLNIAAVNLSLGGRFYSDVDQCDSDNHGRKLAVDNLRSVGIVTIAAAGNQGQSGGLTAPACISSVVSAGSTTKSDSVSDFSNVSSFLDFFAPGEHIYSSRPGGTYHYLSGTSMAAPHVAGAWAILRSIAPGASVEELLHLLKDTGRPIEVDRDQDIVRPRIRLDRAVEQAASWPQPDATPTTEPTPTPEATARSGGSGLLAPLLPYPRATRTPTPVPPTLTPEATATPVPTITPRTETVVTPFPEQTSSYEVLLPAVLR